MLTHYFRQQISKEFGRWISFAASPLYTAARLVTQNQTRAFNISLIRVRLEISIFPSTECGGRQVAAFRLYIICGLVHLCASRMSQLRVIRTVPGTVSLTLCICSDIYMDCASSLTKVSSSINIFGTFEAIRGVNFSYELHVWLELSDGDSFCGCEEEALNDGSH